MNSGVEIWFYCIGQWWLFSSSNNNRSKPCEPRSPSPSISRPRPERQAAFTVHAYSLEQARALVAAKVAGETIVVAVARDGAGR